MTKEVMKQEQDDSVSYIKEVIEALYENSDPVSVEAGELLERIVAKQEQDEPVAMRYDFDGYGYKYIDSGSGSDWQTREKGAEPLYTTPQTKEWVGLNGADWNDFNPLLVNDPHRIAEWVERILKNKNT